MRRAYAGGRRWALLAVVALILGVSTAGAQVTPAPMIRRIIASSIQGSTVHFTIAAGSMDGVQTNWKAWLLRGNSDQPLPGDELKLIRVDKAVTIGESHVTPDGLAGSRALLSP
jgi:siroheme synthase (precorrin-2 oxidase/ferrochelatase)